MSQIVISAREADITQFDVKARIHTVCYNLCVKLWTNKTFFVGATIILGIALLLLVLFPENPSARPDTGMSDPFKNPVYCKAPWPDAPVFLYNAQAYLLPIDVVARISSGDTAKRMFSPELVIAAEGGGFAYENYTILFADSTPPSPNDITAAYREALNKNGWQNFSCEAGMDRARGSIVICSASRHTPIPEVRMPTSELNDHLSIIVATTSDGVLIGHHRLIPLGASSRCPSS